MKAGRSSSPIVSSTRTCAKIWPKATPLRRFNAYHIFDCSSGEQAGLCRITIRCWAIQPLNWVWSDPEMSQEFGNFWPLSSWAWGIAGAALAARVTALANCVLKPRTSSPDCCASRVIIAYSSHSSSSVPAAASLLLVSSCWFVRLGIGCDILVWLHCVGRNCFVCRSVISFCSLMICAEWSHTLCIMSGGYIYWATPNRTSWDCLSQSCVSSNLIPSTVVFTISLNSACSSTETRATLSCWFDSGIATNQAHLPMPILCVKFRESQSHRYYNNQQNQKGLSCSCCCCCVSNRWMYSCVVMSFAVTGVFRVTGKPGMCSQISSPVWSNHWVVNVQTSALRGCVCPISILTGGNNQLFPKIHCERFLLEGRCKYSLDAVWSVQWFRFENKAMGSSKINSIGSWSTVTVVLVHSNMGIHEGTAGCKIW